MEPTNPFSFDTIVTGDNFCNRESEIEELLSDIRASHNVVVFSQRRYGKTSLIKKVLHLAEREGLLPIYTDIYHILSEDDFVKAYAKAFASVIEGGSIEKILQTLKTILSSLRPRITLDDQGKPEVGFGVESGRDPIMNLEEVFEAVKKYADQKGAKGIVVFDEFQQIGELPKSHRVESIIRGRIQTHSNLSYIFMGSKKHLIFDMFSDPTRPLYGIGKMFPLEKIGHGHLEEFVFTRFRDTGKPLSKDLASRLVGLCESHPYFTQYVSHSLWEVTSFGSSVSSTDLDDAMDLTISRVSPRYESIWELLPIRQRQALIALANLSPTQKLFSSDVIHKYGLASAPSFRKALNGLVDKSLVDRGRDRYAIIDIFFKKWIRKGFSGD